MADRVVRPWWQLREFPNAAPPGELRWAYVGPDGHTVWTETGDVARIGMEEYQPMTRTFIPARLEDNPYLDAKYKAQIQSLPEPLRSKLLKGDFLSGREDHAWRLSRPSGCGWRKIDGNRVSAGPQNADDGRYIGGGGTNDPHVIAPLYGNWFDRLTILQGVDAKNGPELAGQIIAQSTEKTAPS